MHRDVVGVDDPRAKAAQILSKLAAAQQMHVSIQLIGNAAEKSLDRVDKARAVALAELTEALAELPHLAPSKQG